MLELMVRESKPLIISPWNLSKKSIISCSVTHGHIAKLTLSFAIALLKLSPYTFSPLTKQLQLFHSFLQTTYITLTIIIITFPWKCSRWPNHLSWRVKSKPDTGWHLGQTGEWLPWSCRLSSSWHNHTVWNSMIIYMLSFFTLYCITVCLFCFVKEVEVKLN